MVIHGLVAVHVLVNAVARRLNGGGSWVDGLVGVADVIKG